MLHLHPNPAIHPVFSQEGRELPGTSLPLLHQSFVSPMDFLNLDPATKILYQGDHLRPTDTSSYYTSPPPPAPIYSLQTGQPALVNLPAPPPQYQIYTLPFINYLNQEQQLINGLLSKRKLDLEEPREDLKKAKLETRALKAKRPGFTDERFNETTYYFENGLRKVYPYYFTFTTFTKGRWVGESILEVFAREFRAHPRQQYERCINAGTLTVNYEKVDTDYKLKHNDLLANIVHRHEIPVSAQKIQIIYQDTDLVVVNKPPSIPVHPCGRYRHNTMVFILAKDHGFRNLRTIHRLDRLTSGLLMFGRSPAKAKEMETQIRNRLVKKEYVCRVQGEFPQGILNCREPIEVISYKIGVCKVSREGKDSWTEFERVSYNGESSVVLARPHTGRMHQIRVHLQYLGHPIVNDPLYNHPVFGEERGRAGRFGRPEAELVTELCNLHSADNWEDGEFHLLQNREGETGNIYSESYHSFLLNGTNTLTTAPALDKELLKTDSNCYECSSRLRDPNSSELVMFLHALRYSGPNWVFQTSLPFWAESHYKISKSSSQETK